MRQGALTGPLFFCQRVRRNSQPPAPGFTTPSIEAGLGRLARSRHQPQVRCRNRSRCPCWTFPIRRSARPACFGRDAPGRGLPIHSTSAARHRTLQPPRRRPFARRRTPRQPPASMRLSCQIYERLSLCGSMSFWRMFSGWTLSELKLSAQTLSRDREHSMRAASLTLPRSGLSRPPYRAVSRRTICDRPKPCVCLPFVFRFSVRP